MKNGINHLFEKTFLYPFRSPFSKGRGSFPPFSKGRKGDLAAFFKGLKCYKKCTLRIGIERGRWAGRWCHIWDLGRNWARYSLRGVANHFGRDSAVVSAEGSRWSLALPPKARVPPRRDNSSCTDLCGGRQVTGVPTATLPLLDLDRSNQVLHACEAVFALYVAR